MYGIDDRTRTWRNCTKINVDLDVCDITKFFTFREAWHFERPRANWTSTEWCAPRTIPCSSKGREQATVTAVNFHRPAMSFWRKPMEAETLGRLMQAELNKVRDPRWAKMYTWEEVKLWKFTRTNDPFLTLALILLCVCDRIYSGFLFFMRDR